MDMTTYLLMRDRWGSGSATVNLQDKSITPSDVVQYISADSGYDGLSTVTMGAIPSEYIIPSGTISISMNGSYNVEAFASAEVLVNGSGAGNEDAIIERTIISIQNNRVLSIGPGAFNLCGSLTTVSFPSATTIGNSAFQSCSALTTISFPSATSIGSYAFYFCSSLKTVSFPSATTIGSQAFASCKSLTTISFPVATTIGESAFYSCDSLITANFPSATTIGSYAFAKCKSLTTISFPAVVNLGSNAFSACSLITEAFFPSAVTIGTGAFINCKNLTTVSFPKASAFNNGLFAYCFNLLNVYILGSTYVSLTYTNIFLSTPISNYTTSTGGVHGSIFVRESMYSSYITMTNWAPYSDRFVSLTDEQIAALSV